MALFDSTFAPYVPFGSRTLSQGDSGTDVAVVQAVYNLMLKTMNPPQGPMGAAISISGTYDAATVQAVKNIQSYFGLTADGVMGSATYFVYGQGVGPNTTYGGPVYGSRQLAQGNSGGDVTILQNRLNCFRYSSMVGQPATGTFDSATAAAVLAFKRDAEANGDTGFPDNAIAGYGYYDATWIYTFAGGRAIFTGRNGFDVVFVQVVLQNLGYYSGRITGYYDAATKNAVEAFQSAQGISADGVVGPETFYQIGRNNPVAAPKPLGIAWPAVTPTVSTCCVGLTPTSSAPGAFGMAALVQAPNYHAYEVVGNRLPPPSTFGSQYGQYWIDIYDSSGVVFIGQFM
ncbi:MAG: peptidoglycan-binding protein, partial [Sulfobacillus thermotolerans]|nr:peptidoglycan-binding protein [Sulfobacillus thermotolerans]